jgi:hypothetical protein
MRRSSEMDRLLNEMAVYKTELAKGSVTGQFRRILADFKSNQRSPGGKRRPKTAF